MGFHEIGEGEEEASALGAGGVEAPDGVEGGLGGGDGEVDVFLVTEGDGSDCFPCRGVYKSG